MIDLHNHTNYSDGEYTPSVLVEKAARDGLSAIALTDHDCIWGLAEAKRKADEMGIEFVPGVELTVKREENDPSAEIHMLGLFINPTAHLEDIHARVKAEKDAFAYELAAAMRTYSGIPVDVEDMRRDYRGAISTGAFSAYMVRQGMIMKFSERKAIMKQLIAEKKMGPKPEFGIPVEEAIEAIHGAGGIAVLAHPYRTELGDQALFEKLKDYKAKGLDGMECYYSKYKEAYTGNLQKSLQMAEELGLLVSGGCDYHEDSKDGRYKGNPAIPYQVLADLKERCPIRKVGFNKLPGAKYGHEYE